MQNGEKTKSELLREIETLHRQVAALQASQPALPSRDTLPRLATTQEAVENLDRSEFVAALSHELRTPLNALIGYTDLFLEGAFGKTTDEQGEALQRMKKNAQELLDLISAVLDLSRLEAGRLPCEITEVHVQELFQAIQEEVQALCNQVHPAFVWDIDQDLPPLHTDAGKLKVIIKNLIANALKFTKEGCITINTQRHAGGVEIRVSDTGIGIPKEALSIIFEPFQQLNRTTAQGTGLGLHIVQRLLALLGGTITVDSEVGRGSTFCVWMPTDVSQTHS